MNMLQAQMDNQNDYFEQVEELKGTLKAKNLFIKDQEEKISKAIETYETKISKLTDEKRHLNEKYERMSEAKNKLEKLNNDLEERLLNVVSKYENEQKELLEQLKLAHANLVEAKSVINQLEQDRETYRQDCNIAVNLLQCNSTEFINQPYSSLPVNLKERLKSYMSQEELAKLESQSGKNELVYDLKRQASNPLFKLPIFQPTAAAAIMYNFQSVQNQKNEKSFLTNHAPGEHHSDSIVIDMDRMNTSTRNSSENCIENGRVSSKLIAQILKNDNQFSKPFGTFKLAPYVCSECKRHLILNESQTQTDGTNDCDQRSPSGLFRSNTVANGLLNINNQQSQHTYSEPTRYNYHQKCASTDLSSLRLINNEFRKHSNPNTTSTNFNSALIKFE